MAKFGGRGRRRRSKGLGTSPTAPAPWGKPNAGMPQGNREKSGIDGNERFAFDSQVSPTISWLAMAGFVPAIGTMEYHLGSAGWC